jgi:hypothetical protein
VSSRKTTAEMGPGPRTALLPDPHTQETTTAPPTEDFGIHVDGEPTATLPQPELPLAPPPPPIAPELPRPPLPPLPPPGPDYSTLPPGGDSPQLPPLQEMSASPPEPTPPADRAAEPPPTDKPRQSRRGLFVGIILLLLTVNVGILGFRYGWLSLPDLHSNPGEKDAPPAKSGPGEPNLAKVDPNKTDPGKVEPKKGNPGKEGAGTKGKEPVKKDEPSKVEPKKDGPGKEGAGKPKPEPVVAARVFKRTEHVLAAIRAHLEGLPQQERRFRRYFTLAHLHNDKTVPDRRLEQYRVALPALLRHLRPSGEANLTPIDKEKTVLSLDLRSVGWDQPAEWGRPVLWREILKAYPYGLLHSGAEDPKVREAAKKIAKLCGEDLPVVRLDWFLDAAGRAPLRKQLGPDTAGRLPTVVTALAGLYQDPLSAEQAARELGLEDAKALRKIVEEHPRLRDRGLEELVEGEPLPREEWASPESVPSLYQEVARVLGLGIPYRVQR